MVIFKDIGKVFFRVIKDEVIFLDAFQVERGCIRTCIMIEIDVAIHKACRNS